MRWTAMPVLYATHFDRVFIGEGLKDMATEQDEPAFPYTESLMTSWDTGMSLRDYFAAKAMAAMLTSGNGMAPYETDDPEQASSLAYLAYKAADAMLKERAK